MSYKYAHPTQPFTYVGHVKGCPRCCSKYFGLLQVKVALHSLFSSLEMSSKLHKEYKRGFKGLSHSSACCAFSDFAYISEQLACTVEVGSAGGQQQNVLSAGAGDSAPSISFDMPVPFFPILTVLTSLWFSFQQAIQFDGFAACFVFVLYAHVLFFFFCTYLLLRMSC